MKTIVFPGVNGLGITQGVENSYERVLQNFNFNKINLDIQNITKQLSQISEESKRYFEEDKVLFVGGDHSISFPLVLNFLEKYGGSSKLLIFDAHPDLMAPMPEPGHEEWLRAIIEKGFLSENILIVGVRRNSQHIDASELSYAKEKGIKIVFSDEFKERQKEILEFVDGENSLYVSFDIDVFDSTIVASTGYAEKNGLNEEQVLTVLEKIKDKINFFDLVEINLEKGTETEKQKTVLVVRKVLKTLGVE